MISRKRILSNSCRSISQCVASNQCDDDVWFDLNSLIRDHVQEILDKYEQLDDEIWGKIICMERNRRIAKAYARSPVIAMDNRCIGFNGDSIGLRGFNNPFRDAETLQVHRKIGDGVVVAVDEDGNILLQTIERRKVMVFDLGSLSYAICPPDAIAKRQSFDVMHKIFDMKNFVSNMNSDLIMTPFGTRTLENGCFTAIVFSTDGFTDVIDAPVWLLVINVIAMEMLHRNQQLITSLKTLAQDDEDAFRERRRTKTQTSKERRDSGLRDGTLMLGAKSEVLRCLNRVPTPDYDSDTYDKASDSRKRAYVSGGMLNSVLRHLPLNSAVRRPSAYSAAKWKRRSGIAGQILEFESDESCTTHIYSSICESASSTGKRTKSRSTLSKSLRFLLKRSK